MKFFKYQICESRKMILYFLFFVYFSAGLGYHSIDSYGAIPNDPSNKAAHANTNAMVMALQAANNDHSDRIVLLPKGNTYYVFNMTVRELENVVFRIEGTFATSDNITEWENIMGNPPAFPEVHLESLGIMNSTNVTLTGGGTVDGQGYAWWIRDWTDSSAGDHRPFLVHMIHCRDVEISNLHFKNTPFWHLNLVDMVNLHVHDIDIHVDIDKQKEALVELGLWNEELNLPTFPLNTDGIDPSGTNILIENVRMELFDDAVAVKPLNGNSSFYSNCSQNMVIRNVTTLFTVGMAIGSLWQDPLVNCIRNVTFENITMFLPIKGIHVKTNPYGNIIFAEDPNPGKGIISDITYRNMNLIGALWMPIYIGPQQQQQPGTTGTGCSWLYPLVDKCATNPNVYISNILLEDVNLDFSLLWPGTINCDAETKCKNMTFKNVQNNGPFMLMPIYECHNVEGVKSWSNNLPLTCMDFVKDGRESVVRNDGLKIEDVKRFFPDSKILDLGPKDEKRLGMLKSLLS